MSVQYAHAALSTLRGPCSACLQSFVGPHLETYGMFFYLMHVMPTRPDENQLASARSQGLQGAAGQRSNEAALDDTQSDSPRTIDCCYKVSCACRADVILIRFRHLCLFLWQQCRPLQLSSHYVRCSCLNFLQLMIALQHYY